MTRLTRIFARIAVAAIAVYGLCLAGLYVDQRHLIFHPEHDYTAPGPGNAGHAYVEFPVVTDDGLALKGWYHAAAPGHPTIVFFHGNADGLLKSAPHGDSYIAAGYGFLIVEYRGFSGMPGAPSEDGLYRDARAYLLALAARGISGTRLILFGHSLGTGVATRMASEFPVGGLALLAPFMSVAEMAQLRYPMFPAALFTTERFESFRKIALIHCPLLIGHGLADHVIPDSQGRALFALAVPPKTLHLFPGLDHNNAWDAFATVFLPWAAALKP